jgi:hypothetical protein
VAKVKSASAWIWGGQMTRWIKKDFTMSSLNNKWGGQIEKCLSLNLETLGKSSQWGGQIAGENISKD